MVVVCCITLREAFASIRKAGKVPYAMEKLRIKLDREGMGQTRKVIMTFN